jgi:hypothetical protein
MVASIRTVELLAVVSRHAHAEPWAWHWARMKGSSSHGHSEQWPWHPANGIGLVADLEGGEFAGAGGVVAAFVADVVGEAVVDFLEERVNRAAVAFGY